MTKRRKEKGDVHTSPDSSNDRIGVSLAPNNIITKEKGFVNVVFVFVGGKTSVPIKFEELKDANELMMALEDAWAEDKKIHTHTFPSGESAIIPLSKLLFVYSEFVDVKPYATKVSQERQQPEPDRRRVESQRL